MITTLTVLYDASCGFCCRCRDWLLRQPSFLTLEFLADDSEECRKRFPGLRFGGDDELTVIDDKGGVYIGSAAFLMCLYALVEYRAWSLRLAKPSLMPLARQGFELVSTRRHRMSDWLNLRSDAAVGESLAHEVGAGSPHCVRNSV